MDGSESEEGDEGVPASAENPNNVAQDSQPTGVLKPGGREERSPEIQQEAQTPLARAHPDKGFPVLPAEPGRRKLEGDSARLAAARTGGQEPRPELRQGVG